MKNSNFTSDVQKLQNALNNKDLKFIKEQVKSSFYITSYDYKEKEVITNEIGIDILKLVSENSNDFTKDIATKCLENKYELSDKQAWCIAYQVINNIEVYILSFNESAETEKNKFNNEATSENNEKSKSEKNITKYQDLIDAKNEGREKIEAYIIKHSDELRYFTKFQKDYWKQWSLSFEKVAVFTDLDQALDVLNKLNKGITEANPNDTRKHSIVRTSEYI